MSPLPTAVAWLCAGPGDALPSLGAPKRWAGMPPQPAVFGPRMSNVPPVHPALPGPELHQESIPVLGNPIPVTQLPRQSGTTAQ